MQSGSYSSQLIDAINRDDNDTAMQIIAHLESAAEDLMTFYKQLRVLNTETLKLNLILNHFSLTPQDGYTADSYHYKDKITPLIAAVIKGNLLIVKTLLTKKLITKINHKDAKGFSALMHALKQSNPQVIALLVQAGAKLEIEDEKLNKNDYLPADEKTALENLRALFQPESYTLSNSGDSKADEKNTLETKANAVSSGSNQSGNVNVNIELFMMMLHQAVSLKFSECTQYLIIVNAELGLLKKPKFSHALAIAVSNNDLKIIEILLTAGANPLNETLYSSEFKGKTPLALAVKKENQEILQLLLDPSFSSSLEFKPTQLTSAAIEIAANPQCFAYFIPLLQQCPEKELMSMASALLKNKSFAAFGLLVEAGINVITAFYLKPCSGYSYQEDITAAQALVEAGQADIIRTVQAKFSKDEKYATDFAAWQEELTDYKRLNFAIENGLVDLVKILLEAGAKITDHSLGLAFESQALAIISLLAPGQSIPHIPTQAFDGVDEDFCIQALKLFEMKEVNTSVQKPLYKEPHELLVLAGDKKYHKLFRHVAYSLNSPFSLSGKILQKLIELDDLQLVTHLLTNKLIHTDIYHCGYGEHKKSLFEYLSSNSEVRKALEAFLEEELVKAPTAKIPKAYDPKKKCYVPSSQYKHLEVLIKRANDIKAKRMGNAQDATLTKAPQTSQSIDLEIKAAALAVTSGNGPLGESYSGNSSLKSTSAPEKDLSSSTIQQEATVDKQMSVVTNSI